MYSKEKQQEHISQIRRILVMKPDATILEIKELLSKQRKPLNLDKDYINRLVNEIRKERAKRFDNYTVNKVLAEFQDETEETKKRFLIIANDPNSSPRDKIAALREFRNSSIELFNKMFDSGIFERKIGELKVSDTEKKLKDLINEADNATKQELAKIAKRILSDKRERTKGDNLPE